MPLGQCEGEAMSQRSSQDLSDDIRERLEPAGGTYVLVKEEDLESAAEFRKGDGFEAFKAEFFGKLRAKHK